jgi:uncharacterized membrane protein YfcA
MHLPVMTQCNISCRNSNGRRDTAVAITEFTLIALLGLASGLMIGCIGIGGVILVPALVFLADLPIKICISAAMAAFILSGLVATAVFASHKSIHWGMAIWLCIGAAPAAFAGAWAVSLANPRVLEAGLGLLTFGSGLNSLRRYDEIHASGINLSNKVLLPIGAVTGLLSSVSGTGGPLVLVPILISMSVPVLTAVGLSQAVQLPVAIAATFGNVLYGKLDLVLGSILAATLTIGSWYGARLAHVVPRAILRRIVSATLVVIGAFILGNVGWRLLG